MTGFVVQVDLVSQQTFFFNVFIINVENSCAA